MKVAVLFSGGKDSSYAAFLAKKENYDVKCLITIESKNPYSFMFHTPSINCVKKQTEVMGLPLIYIKSKGEKEKELRELEKAIKKAVERYKIQGVVTGAIESVYQASRIQKICNKSEIECFNPLWQKNQFELLNELVKNRFKIIIVGVFAYPLDEKWLGRKINKKFIEDMKILDEKYKINPSGEGGEYESFVLNCPLFRKKLKIKSFKDNGEGNSWIRDIEVK